MTLWHLSAAHLKCFLNECSLLRRWYLPAQRTESTESNGEHCVVMHSPPRLLWGLSRKKKKSTEELQEWKMLVCQFVTKAVCSCVIDWQTVLAHNPWGHTGYCCRVTFFFFGKLLSFSEAVRKAERSHWIGVLEQTCSGLVRLLASVKVYGLSRTESPQSTIMTRKDNKKKLHWMDPLSSVWVCLKNCQKLWYNDIEENSRTLLEVRIRPPGFHLTVCSSKLYLYRPGWSVTDCFALYTAGGPSQIYSFMNAEVEIMTLKWKYTFGKTWTTM